MSSNYPGYGGGNNHSPYIANQQYYDSYGGGGGNGSPAAPKFGNEKMEEELSQHIKKATSNDESAPKQKHVRGCILYTWDLKSSGSFWFILKTQPIIGDDVMSWKTLITAHKVVREGHNSVSLWLFRSAYVISPSYSSHHQRCCKMRSGNDLGSSNWLEIP
jgi:hypothetical protein